MTWHRFHHYVNVHLHFDSYFQIKLFVLNPLNIWWISWIIAQFHNHLTNMSFIVEQSKSNELNSARKSHKMESLLQCCCHRESNVWVTSTGDRFLCSTHQHYFTYSTVSHNPFSVEYLMHWSREQIWFIWIFFTSKTHRRVDGWLFGRRNQIRELRYAGHRQPLSITRQLLLRKNRQFDHHCY